MKELWIKKTIYRRYLIKDEDIEDVKTMLQHAHEENKKAPPVDEHIENIFDVNDEIEYDDEQLHTPLIYIIEGKTQGFKRDESEK